MEVVCAGTAECATSVLIVRAREFAIMAEGASTAEIVAAAAFASITDGAASARIAMRPPSQSRK